MLLELIHKARRRLLFNEIVKQFALSAALAIGGLAALLTLGTRYLEWWVVGLFAIGVVVWAVAKLRKRLPGDYAAAVWLDDKAGLHDSLSTAHYFSTHPAAVTPESRAILETQRGQAEAAAGGVDVSITVPFRFPKALYGVATLLLVSTGLVTIRYFYGHELNLQAPITEVIFQDLALTKNPTPAKPVRKQDRDDLDEANSLLSKLGLGAGLEDKPDEKLDEALADALKSPGTPGSPEDANSSQKMDQGDSLDGPKDKPQKNDNSGAQPGNQPGDKKSGEPGDTSSSQGGQSSGDKSDKSLLSKLKDAMDSMMSAPNPSNDKKGNASKSQSKASPQSSQSQTGQPGEAGDEENKTPASGEASGNAQKSNTSSGTVSGKSDDKQEGPSAAGSEDGEKAIKAAAQMKAMGKISELIGKRSDQVTGESMVDVQSGNQKLQTAYKDKAATHGEGEGDVSRDQIPMSVQAYVQEYFQQVRKGEGKSAATAPAAKRPPTTPPNPAPPSTKR